MGRGKGDSNAPPKILQVIELREIKDDQGDNYAIRHGSFLKHPTIIEPLRESFDAAHKYSAIPQTKERVISSMKRLSAFLRTQDTFPYVLAFSIVNIILMNYLI